MKANDLLRYGTILVDITKPYSNERLYCIEFKGVYYELTKKLGKVVRFIRCKGKPRHLKLWQELSYNKYCTKIWYV